MSPTSSRSPPLSSSIKGGGRAAISEEALQEIICLLQATRDESNPLLPKDDRRSNAPTTSTTRPSAHDLKREQKRFVKRLVECHKRQALASELNYNDKQGSTTVSRLNIQKHASRQTASSPRVRIQFVEAISLQNKKKNWKEGSIRKTLVLNRSTCLQELFDLAKSKLRMKKQPNRVFIVSDKMEIDLTQDLNGVADGAVVYVSAGKSCTPCNTKKKKDDTNESSINEQQKQVDPLEAVKRAYAERRRKKKQIKNSLNQARIPTEELHLETKTREPQKHSNFSQCLDQLQPLSPSRAELPAAAYRNKILTALDHHRVIVISGETGCGKSTQVPQFLLEGMDARDHNTNGTILVTQPRRVAAMSLAERVANERSSPPPGKSGSQVGYIVRLARATTPTTKIVYCTVGILLRMLVNQTSIIGDDNDDDAPLLSCLSMLVIDEVHERDLNTDFCLTLLKTLLKTNKDLKILLMSATTSPELFVRYFSMPGIEPVVIKIPGRTFPVTKHWLSDCERLAGAQLQGWTEHDIANGQEEHESTHQGFDLSPRATSRIDNSFVCKLIGAILRQGNNKERSGTVRKDGSILVFLPGKGEIEALASVLRKDSVVGMKERCRILLLHSKVHPSEQRAVFQLAKAGTVKVVLATNVAETSITIPDVSVVIDTGRVKESRFNSSTRIKELTTVWTSQASATQRAGRAGRTGPGICYKLYSSNFSEKYMPRRTCPEVMRTPLDELVLQVCLLEEKQRDVGAPSSPIGTSPVQFLMQAPEPPPARQVLNACKHLFEAGALSLVKKEPELLFRLTPLGFHLSHLPMDAKVGKVLIVGCILECVEPSLTVAAALSCPKTCWLRDIGRHDTKESARELHTKIIQDGFGGASWKGGTVKGDLIAVIAAYNQWASHINDKERRKFARENALDHNCLCDMRSLRKQFRESVVDAGFLGDHSGWEGSCDDDALLTSCCLVAGLYPNISTLLRPNKAHRIRGGRLITKDGSSCRPSSSSFQADRIRNASESGKDSYAVFHSKHRSVGAGQNKTRAEESCFLSEINFVSRFSILLFGGELEMKENALIADGWLKFKVGDKGQRTGAILIQELRKELDNVMLKHIAIAADEQEEGRLESQCNHVMQVVRKLLSEE